jgi:pyruvate dehydrogenase E1 component alpha subunit
MSLSADKRRWMYQQMLRSRVFEDRMLPIYMEGKQPIFDWGAGPLPGEMHLSYGQESVSAGMSAALEPKDWVHAAHRPHHMAIARGVELKAMAAELFGKRTGLSGGRGGHMHIYDRRVNFLSSAIVGEQMGAAAGLAWSAKAQGTGAIAVVVIGDGGANQGAFHEVLNIVALHKLPFICVIEDNNWAVSVSKQVSTAIARNSDRAASYGITGRYVEGNDPDLIYETVKAAADRARHHQEPSVLEFQTYRLKGHFVPDSGDYVPKAERDAWPDCVQVYRRKLLADGGASEAQLVQIEREVDTEIDAVYAYARESEYPAPHSALEMVYAAGLNSAGVRT